MILRYQIFFGVMALATFFSWTQVKKKYGLIAFALLSWVLISACITFLWPEFSYDILSLRLRLVSARAFGHIVMLIYFVNYIDKKRLLEFLEYFFVINCVIYAYIGYGLFNAGSMDMAALAMIYPLMLLRPAVRTNLRIAMIAIPPICFVFNRPGATVFCALALGFGSYLALIKRWKWILIGTLPFFVIGYLKEPGSFLNDSGRFEPWQLIMGWWLEHANLWIGMGTASMQWLGPTIQNKNDGLLLWMHNEYLQVLFEQGIIGLMLMTSFIFICLKRAIKTPWLMASCMSTLFVFTTQFPLRFLFSQIFVLLLIRLCLDGGPNDCESM